MIKCIYKTNAERIALLQKTKELGKIIIEDALHLNENYIMTIDKNETKPYILVLPKTELELLQEDNSRLWYESMSQSTEVETNKTGISSLWYEIMNLGGM